MNWEKKGVIFLPDGAFNWNKSHAQVPVVDVLNDYVWRIYYASRDIENRSYLSYFDVEAGNPQKIIYVHNCPILDLGPLGSFDEHGIMPASIVTINKKKYLYYIGWSLKKSTPYQNTIGLAISNDEGRSYHKFSMGPIIGVDAIDPYFTGTIYVLPEKEFFRAYYLSCVGWKLVDNKPESTYVIKYATSSDGVQWLKQDHIAIPLKNELEGGIVSASVIKFDEEYYMWFSFRNYFDFRKNPLNSYKLGFAESKDGFTWVRNDQKNTFQNTGDDWDSEMICYPNIIKWKGELFMFYNGNGFGYTGIGLATSKII